MFIMSLINAHHFLVEKAFIQFDEEKYYLVVVTMKDYFKNEYKSAKGSMIAFSRIFGLKNTLETDPKWTSFYFASEKIILPEKIVARPKKYKIKKIVQKTIYAVTALSDNEISQTSVTEIATNLNVNPSYLSRIFFQNTGIFLIHFINGEKMARAMQMAQEEIAPADVARKIGFARTDYFISVFRQKFAAHYTTFNKGTKDKE